MTPEQLAKLTTDTQLLNIASRAVSLLETADKYQGQLPDDLHQKLVSLEIEVGRWKEGR